MDEKDVFILESIVDFCDRIANSIQKYGDSFEVFDNDLDFQDACGLRIIQIGENVNSLSNRFKETHPEILWKNIIGTRNIIVHDYGVISNRKVWETLKNDIPALRDFCAKQIS